MPRIMSALGPAAFGREAQRGRMDAGASLVIVNWLELEDGETDKDKYYAITIDNVEDCRTLKLELMEND